MNPIIIFLLFASFTTVFATKPTIDLPDYNKIDPTVRLTEDVCKQKEYKKLHSCKLLKQDKKKLKKITDEYFFMFDFYNSSTPVNYTADTSTRAKRETDTIDSLYDSLLGLLGRSPRDGSMAEAVSDTSHNVVKRATINHCASNYLVYTQVSHAVGTFTGDSYELIQNPGDNLYQMFYIKTCAASNFYNLQCVPETISYKTLVYLYPPGVSDEVGTKYVNIVATCAAHQQLN